MSDLKENLLNLFRRHKDANKTSSKNRRKNHRNNPDKGTQILVIDDSITAQKILKKIFTQAGYEVVQAFDGESGIALAQQYKPALILMDVIMPGISGFQATRMIRNDPEIAATPIVIVSGNKQAGDQFWLSSIGADHYLAKPFSRTDLFSALDKLLYADLIEKSDASNKVSEDIVEPDKSYDEKNLTVGNELKILVVDDSKTVQYQMKKMLIQRGYDVLQAYDAKTGIIMAKKNMPALIVMDVVMPGINGFQATRLIKKDKQIADIPVIVISGNKQASDQFWAIKLGADDYLSKPFSRNDLFASIDKTLHVESRNSSQGIDTIIEPDTKASYEDHELHD